MKSSDSILIAIFADMRIEVDQCALALSPTEPKFQFLSYFFEVEKHATGADRDSKVDLTERSIFFLSALLAGDIDAHLVECAARGKQPDNLIGSDSETRQMIYEFLVHLFHYFHLSNVKAIRVGQRGVLAGVVWADWLGSLVF